PARQGREPWRIRLLSIDRSHPYGVGREGVVQPMAVSSAVRPDGGGRLRPGADRATCVRSLPVATWTQKSRYGRTQPTRMPQPPLQGPPRRAASIARGWLAPKKIEKSVRCFGAVRSKAVLNRWRMSALPQPVVVAGGRRTVVKGPIPALSADWSFNDYPRR